MERLSYHPSQPTITHSSHHHRLELHNPQTHPPLTANSPPCGCCGSPIFNGFPVYTCSAGCNFLLHGWCGDQSGRITHPAHGTHSLRLLPEPAYQSGIFTCNGCRQPGSDLSFHCSHAGCNFDLHVTCAGLPRKIKHHSHDHELSLLFDIPYNSRAFSCSVCRVTGHNQWVYHCRQCNFDAHLSCVTATAAAAQAQPAHLTRSIRHADYSPAGPYHWHYATTPPMHYYPTTPPMHYNHPYPTTPAWYYHHNPRPVLPGATAATGMVGVTLLAAVLNGFAQEFFKSFLG